ncbi:MAG TPA: ABC transporter permease [Verrucomicrobiae bacterium]|nr:ABC transporter permease [Verrucomicrobiae bacterium]
MTIHDQIRAAFSNVGRRKLRSALASLGVVVGTVTIVLMVSLAAGVRRQINHQFETLGLDRLTVYSAGGRRGNFNPFDFLSRKKPITPQDIKNWRALPGVAKVVPDVNLPGSVGLELNWNGTNLPVRMSGGDFRPGIMTFQEPPQAMAGSLELSDAGGIILSQGAARAAGVATNDFARVIGQNVETVLRTSRGETQGFRLHVEGISQNRAPAIQVSLADRIAMKNWWFNTTNTLERDGYDSVTLRCADVSRANELSAQLRNDGFQVQSLEVFVTAANRILTVVTIMFTLIGGIALLVATIGIANTMVMAIYERTREIGILKAMGASRGEIRQMFMLEAGFIGMIGGVAGLFIGWLLGLGLNQAIEVLSRIRGQPLHGQFFLVTPLLALGAIAFATFIGLVAGLLPAQRAAKLDPLEALRHE